MKQQQQRGKDVLKVTSAGNIQTAVAASKHVDEGQRAPSPVTAETKATETVHTQVDLTQSSAIHTQDDDMSQKSQPDNREDEEEIVDAEMLLDMEVTFHDGGCDVLKNLIDGDICDSIAFVIYTRASTPGCTRQCAAFNEKQEKLHQLGITIVGVSLDGQKQQAEFAKKLNLTYPLLTGPTAKTILETLGALHNGKVIRSLAAIDRFGNVFYNKHKVSAGKS